MDTCVDISPPRARLRSASHVRRYRLRKLRRVKTNTWLRSGGARWPFQFLLSLVPGLGHIVGQRYLTGIAYAAVTVTLVLCGLQLHGRIGQALLGLAAGVHANSMLFILPRRERDDAISRMLIVGCLMVGLMYFLYWPLQRHMSWQDPTLQRMARGTASEFRNYYIVEGANSLLLSAIAFVFISCVLWLAGVAVSGYLGERKRRHGQVFKP